MKRALLFVVLAITGSCAADNYRNFDVAIYILAGVVHSFENPDKLENDWNIISNQLKVDKVYIEAQRDHLTNNDALLDRVKQFFIQRGVRVAGGMALSDGSIGGQFHSFCYTDPNDRAFIRSTAELAARHFDETRCTDRRFLTHEFSTGYVAGNATSLQDPAIKDILYPEITFFTNEAWSLVRAEADGNAFPLLLMDRYAKGILYVQALLYVLTIPDNFNELYALPPEVTTALKNYLMRGFPMRFDGPAKVALFAYDNHTFIVESYLDSPADVTVSVAGDFGHLKNIVTGESLEGRKPLRPHWSRDNGDVPRFSFNVHLLPHSYEVFEMER